MKTIKLKKEDVFIDGKKVDNVQRIIIDVEIGRPPLVKIYTHDVKPEVEIETENVKVINKD